MTTRNAPKRTRSPRPAVRERSRRQILDGAHALVRESGVDALTMRLLGERSGISVQTIYSLFGTKQGVIQALIDDEMQRLARMVSGLSVADPIDALREGVEMFVSTAIERTGRSMAAVVLSEGAGDGVWLETHGGMAEVIERAVAEGVLTDDVPARELVEHYRGAFTQWMLLWARGSLSDQELRARSLAALGLALLAVATPSTRERLLRLRQADTAT